MKEYRLAAPCRFGIEGIAADEFRRMGFEEVTAENGRVMLSGSAHMIARANICSRFAERIMLVVGEFEAVTFNELFEGVKALRWEDYLRRDDAFPVNGWSLDSALFSIPDCQSIIKKAIVERLKQSYAVSYFEETGPEIRVRFSIHKNRVTLMLDTSGEGLHKRGYRRVSNDAPLKETLAAAICDQVRVFPDTLFLDPFCGSGTLLIEAALIATKTAPGLRRYFAAERFGFLEEKIWREERMRAQDQILHGVDFAARGYDLDPACVELTLANAKKAGVEHLVKAAVADIRDFKVPDRRCVVATNPPYGERLLDVQEAEKLYAEMGRRFVSGAGRKFAVISPHDEFEKHFGRIADKRRKLYNGQIACRLFLYFKNGGEKNEKIHQ